MTLVKPDEHLNPTSIEKVLLDGDLASLRPDQRLAYYKQVCENLGLDPLTRPFQYIVLNRKLTLYASKACTDQLRTIKQVSITSLDVSEVAGCYIVVAHAKDVSGRTDSDMGSVPIDGLRGDNLCNAMKKAVTQAKRRVTLSLCGLGMLDETETTQIKGAEFVDADEAESEDPNDPRHNPHVPGDESRIVAVDMRPGDRSIYDITIEYPATNETGDRVREKKTGFSRNLEMVETCRKFMNGLTPVTGRFRKTDEGVELAEISKEK